MSVNPACAKRRAMPLRIPSPSSRRDSTAVMHVPQSPRGEIHRMAVVEIPRYRYPHLAWNDIGMRWHFIRPTTYFILCQWYNRHMRTQTVQTLLMWVVIWVAIGLNVVCIVHCHTNHTERIGSSRYVCTQHTTPESPLPIDYATLTHLSHFFLVTLGILCVVLASSALVWRVCHCSGHTPSVLSPPPKLIYL